MAVRNYLLLRRVFLSSTLLLCTAVVSEGASFRTVFLSGDRAPGTSGNTVFSGQSFEAFSINSGGQSTFTASLALGPSSSGIWSEGDGGLELVALSNSIAPGTGSSFSPQLIFADPNICLGGQVAFLGEVEGPGIDNTNRRGIWSTGMAGLSLVARSGSQAPGTASGVNFGSSFGLIPMLSASGQVAFYANLVGPAVDSANDKGLWSQSSGDLHLVARAGSAAPGTEAGTHFSLFDLNYGGQINEHGHTAFWAKVTGPDVVGLNDGGIWIEREGNVQLVLREGSVVPDAEPNVVFSTILTPALNGADQFAFVGQLYGPGVNSANDSGIWSDGSGMLKLVAREGSQAPGTSPGEQFDTFFLSAPHLNSAGKTAFSARLVGEGIDGANDTGIWSDSSGVLQLVARDGAPAPGIDPVVNFDFSIFFNGIAFNGDGRTAFLAGLTGPGVNMNNNSGIWAESANGLQLVVRKGGTIEVRPGLTKTVFSLDFPGDINREGGGPNRMNDNGQLVFGATFTDGSSGLFVAQVEDNIFPTGDYSRDGQVNAADYTVWRNTLGQTGTGLAADGNLNGSIESGDYDLWRAHFGQTAGSGSGANANATVPEPATWLLLILVAAGWYPRRRRAA